MIILRGDVSYLRGMSAVYEGKTLIMAPTAAETPLITSPWSRVHLLSLKRMPDRVRAGEHTDLLGISSTG